MHPTIVSDVAKHRIADWHRQADRDGTARAARAARRKQASHFRPGHLATVLARRVRAALGAPGLRPAHPDKGRRPHRDRPAGHVRHRASNGPGVSYQLCRWRGIDLVVCGLVGWGCGWACGFCWP